MMKQESVVRWYLVLFFIKVALLGIFFIPRWEVPDETGHLSYIADIAEGRGIPVLGEANMIPFISEDLGSTSPPEGNWLAQHPPLYYLTMAPFYKAARSMGMDMAQTVHVIRILNVIIATFFLYFCYRLCKEENSYSDSHILVALILMGSIPMFSNIGTGVNNSMLLGLLLTLGFWQSVCYYNHRSSKYIYRAAVFMGLAGITKYTALPVIFVWGVIFGFLEGFWKSPKKLLRVTTVALLCVTPILVWSTRNYLIFEQLLPLSGKTGGIPKLDMNILEVIRHYNVIEFYYNGFFCLLGWIGVVGDGGATLLPLPQALKPFYQSLYVLLAAGVFWQSWKLIGSHGKMKLERIMAISIIFIGIISALALTSVSTYWIMAGTCLWLSSIGMVFSNFAWDLKNKKINNHLFTAASYLILLGFIIPLAVKCYHSTLLSGYLRGAWGKYFFPFAGPLLIGFVLPGFKTFSRVKSWIFVIPVVAQLCEFWLWINYVSHFYLR